MSLMNLGAYRIVKGDLVEARRCLTRALDMPIRHDNQALEHCLRIWSVLFAEEGRLCDAARLIAFADMMRLREGHDLADAGRPLYSRLMQLLRDGLASNDLEALRKAGEDLSAEEAIAFVKARL